MKNGPKIMKDKEDLYVDFDNGKRYTPKEIADMVLRLRKTGSGEELVFSLIKEYDFTIADLERFRLMMKSMADNWDLFGEMNKKK